MQKILKYFYCFVFVALCLPNVYANNFAYIVVDGQSGKVMSQHRSDDLRPPASLTKKMTLYLIFEALHSGKITMQTEFKVSKRATKQEPCNLGLRVGEKINVKNIIYSLITRSANDISVVAAEGLAGSVEAFSSMMNKKAKALGMSRTKFCNPHGLPARGQITSARDMVILARALHRDYPKEYALFKTKEFFYNGKPIHNHNRMLKSFSGMDGIKTGFTFASRFNISVSAQRIGVGGKPIRLFAVVLGGQTSVSRDKKTAELMEKAFKKLNALPRLQQVSSVSSANEEVDMIGLIAEEFSSSNESKNIANYKASNARKRNKKKIDKPKDSYVKNSLKDPIEEILNSTSSVYIDINRDLPNLPTGWVKANPA